MFFEFSVISDNRDILFETNDYEQAVIYADKVWIDSNADQPVFVKNEHGFECYCPNFPVKVSA